MQYQVSNYYDDNIDYDVSLVELTDTDKKVGRGEYVRILMINNDKHGALWSGRIECVYDIDESLPLLSAFGDFAERNSFGEEEVHPSTFNLPKNLKYVYNGKDITAQIAKRPTELGMKDGDKIFVRGIPPPIDVNFIDEYGKITTLQTRPCVRLSCLFEDYAVQSKMPFLISINMYEFRYNGELLSNNELSLRHISNGSIISNITIYVRLLFTVERVGQVQQFILKNCKGIVRHTPPRKLIGQQVQGVTLGKIVEYIHSGDNISWTAEFDIGFKHKKNLSESMFVLVLESYYKTGGVMFDLLEYVQNKLSEYGGRMQAIIETNMKLSAIDARNMELLKVMKLENEMEKISLIVDWLRKMIIQSELSQMENSLKELLSTMRKFKVEAKSDTFRVNKPILQVGDFVYVISQHVPTWERGIIISYTEHEDIDGYGPRRRRVYSVVFVTGERSDVEDYQVILEKEYLISKDTKESDWKGVKHVVDKDSSDQWAREVGWYAADIEGIEEPFVHLSDALNAYDISQAIIKRGDLKGSDLNHPKDCAALKDDVMKDLNMVLRLMLLYERISDPNMKMTCRVLMQPDRIQFGFAWKEAFGNFGSRYRLYLFAIMNQSAAGISIDQICCFFIGAEGCLDKFLRAVPLFHEAHEAIRQYHSDQDIMTAYLNKNRPEDADQFMFIQCKEGNISYRKVVHYGEPLKEFLTRYADDRGTSIKSLRIKHNGKTLFISSIGKKIPLDLGIKDDDILEITIMQSTATEATANATEQQSPSPKGKNKKKNKKHKKSKKKRTQPLVIQKTEVELKVDHSKLLGKVYEEAEPTFKEIRQRLNALNLERTKPKQKKMQSKKVEVVGAVDNPLSDNQLGGKAGKTQFIIQVGEVSNLYKTTKSSSIGRGRRQEDIMIDLHGLTAEEAVYRLDKHLPDWIETAMKGTYPFVIPVKIVCGGGSQILAEVVENWIKQNDNVANAPKNMYS